jgi:hypothetical protein
MQRQVHDIQNQQKRMDDKQDQMDRHMHQLVDTDPGTDKGKDRRRLKERLKKAARLKSEGEHPVSWMEYIFGICPGDQRMGMKGSR